MPLWNLTLADGESASWTIPHFEADINGVVLSFAMLLKDGTHEVCLLAPTHYHSSKIPTAINKTLEAALDSVGVATGYALGSARGIATGLAAGTLGLLAAEIARIIASEWFVDKEIDDGNYYDSFGNKIVSGLIRVKKPGS